jgi:hypothetical protein
MKHGFGMEPDPTRPYILQGRPNLQYLIDLAERYECADICCTNGQKESRLREPSRTAEGDRARQGNDPPAVLGHPGPAVHRRKPTHT